MSEQRQESAEARAPVADLAAVLPGRWRVMVTTVEGADEQEVVLTGRRWRGWRRPGWTAVSLATGMRADGSWRVVNPWQVRVRAVLTCPGLPAEPFRPLVTFDVEDPDHLLASVRGVLMQWTRAVR